jgi:5-methyltetrahydropteroyltriglutamate--homocysteine methyltransferase
MSRLPHRAEHIGSLLRPHELKVARAAFEDGRLAAAELREVEDRCIRGAVALQERAGLQTITDGEYRRSIYFGHFPAAVAGFTWMEAEAEFTDAEGRRLRYQTPVVSGRLRRLRGIAVDEHRQLRGLTSRTLKVTLPSPGSHHYFRWREGVSDRAYPDVEEFFADVARIYREELRALAVAGADYVQLDDVAFPMLCDARHRAALAARGHDPNQTVDRYVALTNEALRDRPPGLTVGMHMCRGNNQGRWLGEGGYDQIAERVFGGLEIDAFFLEYDSPRAGSFAPLRFMPSGRRVVLGLVSSKTPQPESPTCCSAASRRRPAWSPPSGSP